MTWSAPAVYVNGALIDAADLNLISANLEYLKGQAGVIYLEDALELDEMVAPSTPASGYLRLYAKSTGLLYSLGDNGIESVLGGYSARVYHNTTQSIANNTLTALTFNSERYDASGMHDTSVNANRMTIPVAGRFESCAYVEFAANATGVRYVYMRVNGTTIIGIHSTPPASSGTTPIVMGGVEWDYAAGDYLEILVVQTSGGALNVTGASAYGCEFSMAGPL